MICADNWVRQGSSLDIKTIEWKIVGEEDIYMVSRCHPTNYLWIAKRKICFHSGEIWQSIPLSMWSKLALPVMGQTDVSPEVTEWDMYNTIYIVFLPKCLTSVFLWSMNQTNPKCVHSIRYLSCKCHFHKGNNNDGTILKWRRLNANQMRYGYLDRVLEIEISPSLSLSQATYFGYN